MHHRGVMPHSEYILTRHLAVLCVADASQCCIETGPSSCQSLPWDVPEKCTHLDPLIAPQTHSNH